MRLIVILAGLAGLTAIAGPAPAPAAPEQGAEPGLVVVVDPSGAVRATGQMPRAFPVKHLEQRIPGIDLSGGVTSAGDGDPEEWAGALDAVTIVLPRLSTGEARIAGRRIGISGILRPGFSAGATRGAIRLALGSAWEVEIDLAEAPPAAEIRLRKTAHGLEVGGILPAGLDPPEAVVLLGHARDGGITGGITGGGGGDGAAWGTALARLGEVLALYGEATGRVTQGVVEIDGTLLPGYQAGRLGAWLGAQLGEDWRVSLAGRELAARDGDTRRDLASGGTERLRRGRWLPEFGFEPGPEACASQTRAALAGGQVGFVTGKSQVERAAAALLDRLAGVAVRCLNDGGLRLEIGGHTDDIGDDDANLALSRRRAMTVLLDLIERGVRADAMAAVGFGETRPVADNATGEGRARNRRISFEWSE
ncbi:MAG: OmpA family protein [Proteobacteria bacterium]|nr:OmpA family protein [Pseudomonadota bacterium]